MDFKTLGVVGAGTMGSGIALTGLRAGMQVVLYDVAEGMLQKAREYIHKHLLRKGQEAALENLSLTTDLAQMKPVEAAIEAVPENLSLKQQIFQQLSRICPPPVILASNTSTLPVTAIAAVAEAPERVGGMHFFNPAPVLPLVEVVRAAQTHETSLQAMQDLARQLGKTPVVVADTPGFIVNRVARPFYGEALRLVSEQICTHEQLDEIVTGSAGFAMGPFQLMDLIGIDINFTAMKSVFEQTFAEPRYRPSLLQQQKLHQNALGRKTGRGFYDYTHSQKQPSAVQTEPLEVKSAGGKILIAPGDWAPGFESLLQKAGYTILHQPEAGVTLAVIPAGKAQGLQKWLQEYDDTLPAHILLLAQAVDTTVAEMATWIKHHERLVGFDSLFFSNGQVATLAASPFLQPDMREAASHFVRSLGRYPVWVGDSPGLVVPRILSMLANDAAFAVTEGIAGESTIDQAMQLGVNYPRGPLSWAREIGLEKIIQILEHLQAEYGEDRYRIAPFLRREVRKQSLRSGR